MVDLEIKRARQREYAQRYREKFPERHRAAVAAHTRRNAEAVKKNNRDRMRRWAAENRELDRIKCKKWRDENPDYGQRRYRTNIQFRLRQCMRSRLQEAVKTEWRKGMTVKLLGCSIAELKLHLERQFAPGMLWENYGFRGWHVDHINPLASFDLTDPNQLKKACHFTNLQPLWAEDNLKKGAR